MRYDPFMSPYTDSCSQPQRPRTLRVRDENVVPAFLQTGKTLHQRTKSVPSIAMLASMDAARQPKAVLGVKDKNKSFKVAVKDDLSIGLASPDKIKAAKSIADIANTFVPISKPALPKIPEARRTVSANSQVTALRDVSANVQTAVKPAKPTERIVPVTQNDNRITVSVQQQEVKATEPMYLHQDARLQTTSCTAEVKPEPIYKENIDPQLLVSGVPLLDDQSLPAFTHIDASVIDPALISVAPVSTAQVNTSPVDLTYALPQSSPDLEEDYTTARTWGLTADATLTTLFDPKYNNKIYEEIALAKTFVDQTRTVRDIEEDFLDTSMVAEYHDEIFDYYRELELDMRPDPFYMVRQVELGWSMRAVLIDWIVQVHARFNLLPETLFLTVNYIDRFLTEKVVSIGKLQLVGATAIFLAAKYEEVNCPTLSEIMYMVENGYSGEEILKAERFMLTQLNFRLGWPGPMSFLRRISKADDYDLETRTLAKYFLEVCIMDERFLGLTPSFLAAGSHCMARFMLRKGDWTQAHVYYSNYTFSQLKPLLRGILECLEVPRRHHEAVYVKYSDRRFKRASTYVENEMANGFRLPFMRAY